MWDLNPQLSAKVQSYYDDAKKCLWAELTPDFIRTIPNVLQVSTLSKDRNDYIAHPPTGEQLSPQSIAALKKLRDSWKSSPMPIKGQFVISDGLNAKAIMDENHLAPYLDEMRKMFAEHGAMISDTNIVVTSGRVRVGYRIGELLFEDSDPNMFKGILHIIGERPGTMHHSYSVYITVVKGKQWNEKRIDHDITKLVCNIADTALAPKEAARETLTIIKELVGKTANSSRRYN
jgi:ethanolamine ammonia-lyase large subunit